MNRYLIAGKIAYYSITLVEAFDLEVNTGHRSTRRDNIYGGVDYVFRNVPVHPRCDAEFGIGHSHDVHECARIIDVMENGYGYDPMQNIPWGTPDSWIPDNPNSDGFRQSDFV